ncbi:gp436 family protein [Ferrovibrio sp.]|uniref:gp436 family protein n=1 Tax=Ferrovibrio sp. TaxID=1917215 RepID=UPI0035B33511
MYGTLADMVGRYGLEEITARSDRANTGELDEAIVSAVLADASSIADGYLRTRYSLPLMEPYPRELTSQVCAIARYLLWQDAASERVETDRDNAMAWLRDVAAGKVNLAIDTPRSLARETDAMIDAPAPAVSDSDMKAFLG